MATSSLVADDDATTCAICGATFQRVGHLRRHMASLHLGDRPFACSMCDSRFARRDTLQRHLIVHGGVGAAGAEDIKPRSRQKHHRAARACRNCANARQRCDGNTPCGRCRSNARPCSYPPQRQPRAAVRRRAMSPVLLVDPPPAPPPQEQEQQQLSVVDEFPAVADLGDCMDLGFDDFSSLDSASFPSCIFDPLAILQELDAEWPGAGVPPRLDDAAAESEAEEEPGSPSSSSDEPPVISLTEPANDGQALGFGHSGASLRQEEGLLLPSSPDDDDDDVWQAEDYGHVPAIPPACYSQIRQCYAQVNGGDGHLLYPTTCLDALPSRAALNAFVQLYFEDFHPVFPLLHRPSFDPGTAPWLLVLAVAVTGCRFSRNNVPAARVNAMQELLRRAIQTTMERDRAAVAGEVWLAQAALLNQTGMLHTIDMRLVEHAQTNHALVATLCRRVGCFAEGPVVQQDEESWPAWVARESARRLAYCAWLLDSQQVLLFDLLPAIPIDILRVRVPCLEDLWEAPSEDAWRPIRSSASKSPHLALHTSLFLLTLGTADSHSPLRHLRGELTLLYRTRQRREGLGDFAALMLALAVFRDLQPHLHVPSVSGFPQLPKADNPADLAEQYFEPLLTTAQPARTRLQLATLHHVHLLGVLLRVSLRDLFAFSGWRADSGGEAVRRACARLRRRYSSSPHAAQELRRAVLAAAHLFESLRGSSTRAHHEPIALLVAVLTVWLYSVLDDNIPPGSAGAADEDEAEDDCRRRPLLLGREQNDKGAEDAWVAAGTAAESGISVRLGGVGCIRGGGGTDRRLIREAVRMLLERRAWNLSEAVAGVLTLQVNLCRDGGLHR